MIGDITAVYVDNTSTAAMPNAAVLPNELGKFIKV